MKKCRRLLLIKDNDKKLKQSFNKELNKVYKFFWRTVRATGYSNRNPYFFEFEAEDFEECIRNMMWERDTDMDKYYEE